MNMHVKPSKFKVGDRVRRTTRADFGGFRGSDEFVVSSCTGNTTAEVKDGTTYYHSTASLELAPKFAVGDKVRAIETSNGGAYKKGNIYTVRKVSAEYDSLETELDEHGSTTNGWRKTAFEPVAVSAATYTPCAAAEVDNLADEYGGRKKLQIVAGRYYKTRDGRKVGPMEARYDSYRGEHPWQANIEGGYLGCNTGFIFNPDGRNYEFDNLDLIAEWSAVATQQPTTMADIVRKHSGTAVVMLIENGQPKPATRPYVHGDRAAATSEAERLATTMPGSEFGVYELVTRRVADVVVREVV